MMTVRRDAPGSVAQLLPAASISGVMPSVGELAVEPLPRLAPHRPPRQALRAVGVEVRAASSRRLAMTSRALMTREYIVHGSRYADARHGTRIERGRPSNESVP